MNMIFRSLLLLMVSAEFSEASDLRRFILDRDKRKLFNRTKRSPVTNLTPALHLQGVLSGVGNLLLQRERTPLGISVDSDVFPPKRNFENIDVRLKRNSYNAKELVRAKRSSDSDNVQPKRVFRSVQPRRETDSDGNTSLLSKRSLAAHARHTSQQRASTPPGHVHKPIRNRSEWIKQNLCTGHENLPRYCQVDAEDSLTKKAWGGVGFLADPVISGAARHLEKDRRTNRRAWLIAKTGNTRRAFGGGAFGK